VLKYQSPPPIKNEITNFDWSKTSVFGTAAYENYRFATHRVKNGASRLQHNRLGNRLNLSNFRLCFVSTGDKRASFFGNFFPCLSEHALLEIINTPYNSPVSAVTKGGLPELGTECLCRLAGSVNSQKRRCKRKK
jgi:hypothetical protein